MSLRCAIYARVSTERQRDKHTIDSQLRLLPEHARRQGWKLVDTYVDDGISGKTIEARPAFQRLLADAETGLFDVVLSIEASRIVRPDERIQSALVHDHLRRCGVRLATPEGIIDLRSDDQALVAEIQHAVAGWERRKIVSRMMRGKREAARKGRRFASLDPYGYRWVPADNPNGGSYQIVPEEAKVVRRIYQLALEGMGASMIAWTLNQEGHRTRDIKRRSRPQGGPGEWAATTVKKMLRSSTYKGAFIVFKKDDKTAIEVPVIIDSATWERVQESIGARTVETKWKHERQYLLSGIARCGVCESAMWVVNARPGKSKHAYYRCSSTNAWRKMKMNGPCGNKHHRVDAIDHALWERLVEVLSNPKLLAAACEIGNEKKGVDWAAQAEGAKKKLDELSERVAETLRLERRGLLTPADRDKALEAIKKERTFFEKNLRRAEEQLVDASVRKQRIKDIQDQAAMLARGLPRASFERRRQLVGLLFPREQGCSIQIAKNGELEIQGILPTPSANVEMRLKVAGARF